MLLFGWNGNKTEYERHKDAPVCRGPRKMNTHMDPEASLREAVRERTMHPVFTEDKPEQSESLLKNDAERAAAAYEKVSRGWDSSAEEFFFDQLQLDFMRLNWTELFQLEPHVSLVSLFQAADDDYRKQAALACMHCDFIVRDRLPLSVVCGIEVDGPSHTEKGQHKADLFKEALFERAGIPIIRIPASRIGYTRSTGQRATSPVLTYLREYTKRRLQ